MSKFYNDIGQFKNVIRTITDHTRYIGNDEEGNAIFDHSKELPILTFGVSTKLHGSNAGVVFTEQTADEEESIQFLSRNREVTIESDNYGFASFATLQKEHFKSLAQYFINDFEEEYNFDILRATLFGEWAGGSIQKGVALSNLEKTFFIFDIKLEDFYGNEFWVEHSKLHARLSDTAIFIHSRIKFVYDYPNWEFIIDFNNPQRSVNDLTKLVEEIEKECPVGKEFGFSGIGEGLVATFIDTSKRKLRQEGIVDNVSDTKYTFKCKGSEHSVSKVKTLIPIDTEKLNSIEEFVEYAVTENRLEQMVQKMIEMQFEVKPENIGQFFKFINSDVMKEELDTLVAAGLEPKDVIKPIQNKARSWFLNKFYTV